MRTDLGTGEDALQQCCAVVPGGQFRRTRAAGSLLQLSSCARRSRQDLSKGQGKASRTSTCQHGPSWALPLPLCQVEWAEQPGLSLRLLTLPARDGGHPPPCRGCTSPASPCLSLGGGRPSAPAAPVPPREGRSGRGRPRLRLAAPAGCP